MTDNESGDGESTDQRTDRGYGDYVVRMDDLLEIVQRSYGEGEWLLEEAEDEMFKPPVEGHPADEVRQIVESQRDFAARLMEAATSESGDDGLPPKGAKVDSIARENICELADRIEDLRDSRDELRAAVDELTAEGCDAEKDRVHLEQKINDANVHFSEEINALHDHLEGLEERIDNLESIAGHRNVERERIKSRLRAVEEQANEPEGRIDDIVQTIIGAKDDIDTLEETVELIENTIDDAGRHYTTSDGRPEKPLPERLDEIEAAADAARADTKDESTTRTLVARVEELEQEVADLKEEKRTNARVLRSSGDES